MVDYALKPLKLLIMKQLQNHIKTLRDVFEKKENVLTKDILNEMTNLDSIDTVLRNYLSIEDMREAGSFFTGSSLATAAVNAFKNPITSNSIILDPTCGAGNLLLQCSREINIETSLTMTLKKWGCILWGFDIHQSFIEVTKLRIVMEALSRGAKKDCSIEDALNLLSNITCEDALLVTKERLSTVTHSIMNPPFSIWPSPNTNYWPNAKINSAGIVFDAYLRVLPENCSISAILPDVLRSGSRYKKFRDFVSTKMQAECNIWGLFNKKTNVDVFILSGNKAHKNNENISWFNDLGEYTKLSEYFDVCIGPLVAYRDPETGLLYPYFYSKNSPAWETVEKANEYRRFSGKVIKSPFVIVKRTSSPSDKYRASATLINLNSLSAIENHMIVITPKNGSLTDCHKLMEKLRSKEVNTFINNRSRMRHLTVGLINDIPIKIS